MPLRIPPGWCTVFNKFMELPEMDDLSAEDKDAYLSEDILAMRSVEFLENHWGTTPESIVLDLGWYAPPGRTGAYRLAVLHGNWENVAFTIEDANQYTIRDAIDKILLDLSSGIPPQEISWGAHDG
ncbi:hypothetical protein O1L55_21740 [Streptomyces albulus]|uniref:hypothetical protein n=2 Tax=Streptomyces noursei TaxID=1971 RepID=UPI0022CC1132|nr:hypothetical protein [Streptomyces noursei]